MPFLGFRRCLTYFVFVWAFCGVKNSAHAWIFHEHQVILERALQSLSPEQLNVFDALWQEVRTFNPGRLCSQSDRVEYNADGKPSCLTFSSLAAIAGDHSCSAENMWQSVVNTDWILEVAHIANDTRLELNSKRGRDKINVWNYSNLRFERADPEYSTRAGANFSHFVPFRSTPTYRDYMRKALVSDAPINAAAAYTLNHWAALRFALAATASEDADRRREFVRRALTAEAYAIHFLEDAFASGHVVGQWGGAADAKGTHDHYCVSGIDGTSWSGDSYSAYGDAHMTEIDLEHALKAVASSLQQILSAFGNDATIAEKLKEFDLGEAQQYRDTNTCKSVWVGARIPSEEALDLVLPVWEQTLKPSPGPDEAHLPRFKAEIGSFIGFGFNARLGGAFAGYDAPDSGRNLADIAAFLQFGFGLEGATGLSSDGTFMLGIGFHGQAPQYDLGNSGADVRGVGDSVPRVPGRLGLALAARIPFYVIPGDLLILGPLIAPFSLTTIKQIAVDAADGGLIPWQRIFVTSFGDFQIVLGREVQATLFGISGGDLFLRATGNTTTPYDAIEFNSIELDFPVFQWRFFRVFSQRLTSTLILTLGGGIDIPFDAEYLVSGAKTKLDPAGFFYFKFSFDGRIFFQGPLE